jgi:hypothetical protein
VSEAVLGQERQAAKARGAGGAHLPNDKRVPLPPKRRGRVAGGRGGRGGAEARGAGGRGGAKARSAGGAHLPYKGASITGRE